MNRIRYCHGGTVGDGLCLSGRVTTDETAQCDMGDCCDFDWSGWTGCCRDQNNKNVRLRFRGGCSGDAMDQRAKSCNNIGSVLETCLVVIQNSYAMGIIQGTNAVAVINPDEFDNFQDQILIGQTLGHADSMSTSHRFDTSVVFHSSMQGQMTSILVTSFTDGSTRIIEGVRDASGQFVAHQTSGLNNQAYQEGRFIDNVWYPDTNGSLATNTETFNTFNTETFNTGSFNTDKFNSGTFMTVTDFVTNASQQIYGFFDQNGQFTALRQAQEPALNQDYREGSFVDNVFYAFN